MARRRFKWTSKQIDKLNKVIEVLGELADYKPLTLRQIGKKLSLTRERIRQIQRKALARLYEYMHEEV